MILKNAYYAFFFIDINGKIYLEVFFMIEEKQTDIINKLDNSDEIKRFKELEKKIMSNKEYLKLKKELDNVKTNEEMIECRKKLFEIPEVKEYLKIESEIRLFSKKTSKIISSIVEKDRC